jgi:hypothetical protein
MTTAQDRARVPGYVHSWGSFIFRYNDVRINGITKLGYADSRKRGKGYGAGRHQAPTHRTAGQYECEPASMDLYKETAQAIRNALAAGSESGNSHGNPIFQMEFIASEPGSADIVVTLHDCTWESDKSDHAVGPDGLMDQVTLDVMFIDRDGKFLFDDTEGTP